MKKLQTTINTGDIFFIDKQEYRVGNVRRIDGKMLIEVKKILSKTSACTLFLSTLKLNKLIKQSNN